jgi:hypothetical protein
VKWLGKAVDKFVPVMFQKLSTYETDSEDTRFIKVKIWLMHLEENLNGSYFDKSVVENAIPSLANTPILAYIEDNSNDETDFSDHRMVLIKEDGKFKVKYIGQAIGLIPETNNAQFEMRLCDDGVEREFLTVDGLVWQKWDEPVDIFNRDIIKAQSMELHENYQGEFKEDGLFHFTSFDFFGACALGSEVLPAMHNATIEAQFSLNDIHNQVQEKMEQFKKLTSFEQEGGKKVDEKKKLLEKYSISEEKLVELEINFEEISVEDLEAKLQEATVETTTDFALTAGQLRDEIRAELYKEHTVDDWGWKSHKYWYVDHTENLVIAEDTDDHYRLVGFEYSVENDVVVIALDSKKRVRIAYEVVEGGSEVEVNMTSKDKVEYDLKVKEKELETSFSAEKETALTEVESKLNTLSETYSTLEKEVKELRSFKAEKQTEERTQAENELFERFSAELTEDETSEVRTSSKDLTLEQLEEKLFTLVGKKKANFSKIVKKEKQTNTVKVEVVEKNDELPSAYGGLFEKFGK